MKRERKVIVIIGQRRSGKTTLTRLFAKQCLQSVGKRVRVFDPSGELSGAPFPADVDAEISTLVEKNAAAIAAGKPAPAQLVILDDMDSYAPSNPGNGSAWKRLYITSAQLDCDLICSAKRLQGCCPALLNGADWVFVFRIPRADVTGRERVLSVLSEEDIPTAPFEFVQVSPTTGEKFFGKTVLNADGSAGFVYTPRHSNRPPAGHQEGTHARHSA